MLMKTCSIWKYWQDPLTYVYQLTILLLFAIIVGLSGKQRVIKIQDNAKPLDLQSRYNRGDTK